MATTAVADPPGYNISDEEEQQQQQQQQEEEEYNARRNRNSMFVDDLRSKKRHLEAKQQQQRAVIIAASSDWVPERLKTIDRDPNQPKNIHMSKQTKEIHRNSIPRTSWEPYTIPTQTKNVDNLKSKAFSSTTNDWVPSKYYSKNNSNKNLHPQLNRNNVVTSSYPPNIRPVSLSSMPLVTTSKESMLCTAAAPGAGARSSTDPPAVAATAAAALAAWSARSLYSSSSSSSSPNNNNNNENDDNSTNDNNSNNSGIPQSVSTLIMIKRKRDFLDFRCCCRVIDGGDDNGDHEQYNSSDDDDDDDEKDNNGDRRQQRNQRQRQRHGRCQPLSCGVWMIVSLSIVLLLIWIAIGIGWYFMKPFE
ncbi:hypothetical protein FRACYDRAFT_255321 [Fragilariopsis cylindrus CCMP1102]|uniref:Uncharacterized protein n=1 Tax=Fragilariopsis cylindrus CCMP1102 TaxID=635003 RepID=A0A1E7EK86_9STRA|nr:hypothetical protein FRACYDRAFT_255321 [Fragilariopsis cylindrus CCMP1102]|eukprot:OEU06288.1 hypothetical protein FRACYDRAFT_255321 [Fragilariopsis cylindrus CCMP1102]